MDLAKMHLLAIVLLVCRYGARADDDDFPGWPSIGMGGDSDSGEGGYAWGGSWNPSAHNLFGNAHHAGYNIFQHHQDQQLADPSPPKATTVQPQNLYSYNQAPAGTDQTSFRFPYGLQTGSSPSKNPYARLQPVRQHHNLHPHAMYTDRNPFRFLAMGGTSDSGENFGGYNIQNLLLNHNARKSPAGGDSSQELSGLVAKGAGKNKGGKARGGQKVSGKSYPLFEGDLHAESSSEESQVRRDGVLPGSDSSGVIIGSGSQSSSEGSSENGNNGGGRSTHRPYPSPATKWPSTSDRSSKATPGPETTTPHITSKRTSSSHTPRPPTAPTSTATTAPTSTTTKSPSTTTRRRTTTTTTTTTITAATSSTTQKITTTRPTTTASPTTRTTAKVTRPTTKPSTSPSTTRSTTRPATTTTTRTSTRPTPATTPAKPRLTTTTTSTTPRPATNTTTTARTTSTERLTTTERPNIPEICEGGAMVNGVSYRSHWADCTKFIQCSFTPDGAVNVFIKSCRHGMYWDQTKLACDNARNVDCPYDLCKVPGYERAPSTTNCRGYWICEAGKSVGHCCPPQHSYDATVGCVPDPRCNDPCDEGNPLNVCDKRGVNRQPLVFEQSVAGQGWDRKSCSPGTAFNIKACACIFRTEINKTEIHCEPELYLPFNGDIKDESGNNNYLQVDGVKVVDGTGYFDGKSLIRVPRFSNMDFGSTLIIKLRYKEEGGGSAGGQPQALVANGDCNRPSSLYMVTGQGRAEMGLRTSQGDNVSVSIPSNGAGWKEAVLIADDSVLQGTVTGVSYQTIFTGSIETSRCAMQIGRGTEFKHFTGYMDDVTVYLCRPKGL
ncbi:unnamed protein product [Lymnaea stagnalis]|uniref:Chitin-binding type-2 domain-containing protein n=1 Tax=Lymnaea stagnalis TaxID=6523 RepID=A0AAV2IID5_LYMST